MSELFDPGPRPPELDAYLGELPVTLFDDRIYGCCEIADRYATDLSRRLVRELGLERALAGDASFDELLRSAGFVPAFAPALRALLDRLVESGDLEARSDGGRERFGIVSLAAGDLALLRRSAERFGAGATATLDLLDAAGQAYADVAHGASTGEKELFTAGRIGLWLAYFSNDNPGYVLNNAMAAHVAANRLEGSGGLRILEVGAGAGSASRALLGELERRGRLGEVALYDFTEPSPFFRRRGERELRERFPGLPLRVHAVDIDRPLAEQGCESEYDLIFGVNVLHVAEDLVATLTALRTALRPGGWLVAGECIRPVQGCSVPADLVFQLFDSFTSVATDPEVRPTHGFLSPEPWRRALARAGFAPTGLVPDIERVREIYPRFFTGVVCGCAGSVESKP